ncbi:hypothetical protein FMM05_05965 [Flavobacterium zepuense]|uniref:VCBS repeat-containing protein n=1 Tax=Flavobacterium zepuense TaxID=2593302 RepID=A0A552V5L8_9FLAO|nr:hypothetical protein [Flavobacterium zepuense]TRW25766.1 hypothetical protein FMM05_05965 [Flavobacterium zepuense]
MKLLIAAICLISSIGIYAQTVLSDGIEHLDFKLEFATDTTSAFGIDWKKENLVSDFVLKGNIPLHYSIKIINDTTASLSQFHNDKSTFQENIYISEWTIRVITDSHIISEFKITDFDKDGDEDLTILVASNMNGNDWTSIYLNDSAQNKLVNLYDMADNTAIWNRPEFDSDTGIIHCTLDGSAYGASEESTYKLDNLIAIPLKKSRQERYKRNSTTDFDYIGENGKWKLVRKRKSRG